MTDTKSGKEKKNIQKLGLGMKENYKIHEKHAIKIDNDPILFYVVVHSNLQFFL